MATIKVNLTSGAAEYVALDPSKDYSIGEYQADSNPDDNKSGPGLLRILVKDASGNLSSTITLNRYETGSAELWRKEIEDGLEIASSQPGNPNSVGEVYALQAGGSFQAVMDKALDLGEAEMMETIMTCSKLQKESIEKGSAELQQRKADEADKLEEAISTCSNDPDCDGVRTAAGPVPVNASNEQKQAIALTIAGEGYEEPKVFPSTWTKYASVVIASGT